MRTPRPTTWHGFPYPHGAHLERPWWTAANRIGHFTVYGWRRTDGIHVEEDTEGKRRGARVVEGAHRMRFDGDLDSALAEVDRQIPLRAPGPLPGQVWLSPGGELAMVLRVAREPLRVWWPGSTRGKEYPDGAWPPPGAMLVHGPGAPWGSP